MSDEALRLEREAFERLANDEDLDPQLRAELDARNESYLKDSAARNRTLTEVAAHRDEAYDRSAEKWKRRPLNA